MTKVTINGQRIDFDAAANLMDEALREEIHAAMAPCDPQAFADAYCKEHERRFGETFTVN